MRGEIVCWNLSIWYDKHVYDVKRKKIEICWNYMLIVLGHHGICFLVNVRGMNIEDLVTGPIITCHTDRWEDGAWPHFLIQRKHFFQVNPATNVVLQLLPEWGEGGFMGNIYRWQKHLKKYENIRLIFNFCKPSFHLYINGILPVYQKGNGDGDPAIS